jgi:hypothetical protein
MSPGQTPKLQAVLKSRGLSVLAAHAMERPTQGGFSRATKPHFDCCLLLTKKKKDLSLHIKFQPWMNTGLVGLWLVSLTMFLTTENLIYIHIYIYIYFTGICFLKKKTECVHHLACRFIFIFQIPAHRDPSPYVWGVVDFLTELF